MHIRHSLIVMMAAAIMCFFTSHAVASAPLSAFAIAGGNADTANVSYTSGTLTIFTTDGFIKSKVGLGTGDPVTISFSGLSNTGTYTFNPITKAFDQPLNGGSFIISNGSTTFLSGTFGVSDLVGTAGAQSGTVNLKSNSVTYTGGTLFPASYDPTGGTLAIEFNSVSQFVADATHVSDFTGVDGITFSAPSSRGNHGATPEPGSIATFSLGGIVLLGLLIRSRKPRRGAVLAL